MAATRLPHLLTRIPTPPRPFTGPDIRETFRSMGLKTRRPSRLRGGNTFGKTHARPTRTEPRPEPETPARGAGGGGQLGPEGSDASPAGARASGHPPDEVDNSYFETLFGFEWDLELSPAGLWQWIPAAGGGAGTVPDAHDPSTTHAPTILTTDLALRFDPGYEPIARRFLENPDQLADAFARVWFKLTPWTWPISATARSSRRDALWQDPVPRSTTGSSTRRTRRAQRRSSTRHRRSPSSSPVGRRPRRSAAGQRGGANGARIRLEHREM